MTKKPTALSGQEQQLIQRLREHPELRERFQRVLEICADPEGPIQRADEVEALLIEELRRLGNTALSSWAGRVESRLAEQLQQSEASVRARKKKR